MGGSSDASRYRFVTHIPPGSVTIQEAVATATLWGLLAEKTTMTARCLLWTALLLMTPGRLYADEAEERALKMIRQFGADSFPRQPAPGQSIRSLSFTYTKVTDRDLKELV